jgi:hypothetical protein
MAALSKLTSSCASSYSTPVETPTESPTETPVVIPTESPTETPVVIPAVTLDVTPVVTLDVTPVVTPDVTPEVTPDATPNATPAFWNALISACYQGHADIVEQLIAAGVDINHKDNHGRLALIIACYQGHADIVEQLIAAGADISISDKYGDKAIHHATKSVALIKVLVRAGADWEAKGCLGMQPIHIVCSITREDGLDDPTGRPECLEFLVNECGVDVDAVDDEGHDAWRHVKRWMYPDYDSHPEEYANLDEIQEKMFAIINAASRIDPATRVEY